MQNVNHFLITQQSTLKKHPFIFFLLFILASCNQDENKVQEKETPSSILEAEISTETKLIWHWEDDFSPAEKEKIKKYITEVSDAAFNLLGKYPFDIHYFFHRSDSQNEPIPWAHTERSKKIQGVRFYINPLFSYQDLISDWTAPHEISHLSIPHLGKENSWFAEGYASYMQYQIMQELGVYTKDEVAKKYQEKIDNIKDDYSDTLTFIDNAKALRARYNFPAMYWGSAMYFIQLNQLLESQESISLNECIKKYQSCCRTKDKGIEKLLLTLDKDFKKPVFTNLYNECNTKSFVEIYNF
jgi:hypothetical protein